MTAFSTCGASATVRIEDKCLPPERTKTGPSVEVQVRVSCVASGLLETLAMRNLVGVGSAVVRSGNPTGGPWDNVVDQEPRVQVATACAAVLTPSGAPRINRFAAIPGTIAQGDDSRLEFDIEADEDTKVSIDNGVGDVTGVQHTLVKPQTTTTFTIRATNKTGSSAMLKRVTVSNPTEPPVIDFFVATGVTSIPGAARKLHWCYRGGTGTTGIIDQGIGTLDTNSGELTINPMVTTTYELTVSNAHGADATAEVTVAVLPIIYEFAASDSEADSGSRISLSWQFNEGDASIDNEIGDVESLAGVRERTLARTWDTEGWGALAADGNTMIGYDHATGFRAIDTLTGEWTGDALKDPITGFGTQDEGQSKPWSIAVLDDGFVAVNLEGDFFQVRDATSEFEAWSGSDRQIRVRGIVVLGDRLWIVTNDGTDVDFYYADVSDLDSIPANNRLAVTQATNVSWADANLNRVSDCWAQGNNIRLLAREAGGYWRVLEATITGTAVTAQAEVQYLRRHDDQHSFTSGVQIGDDLFCMTNGLTDAQVNDQIMYFGLDEPAQVGTAQVTLTANSTYELTVSNDHGTATKRIAVFLSGMVPYPVMPTPEPLPEYNPTVTDVRALPNTAVVPVGTIGQIAWKTSEALAVRVYKNTGEVYNGPQLNGWSEASYATGDQSIHVVASRGTDSDSEEAAWVAGEPSEHPPPLVRKLVYRAIAVDGSSISNRFWSLAAATDQDIAEGNWAQNVHATVDILNTRGWLYDIEFFVTRTPTSDLQFTINSSGGSSGERSSGQSRDEILPIFDPDFQHDELHLMLVPNSMVPNSVSEWRYIRWQYLGVRTKWRPDSEWHTEYFRIFEDPA